MTFVEAFRAWKRITAELGTPAPGPQGLTLPPHPEAFARTPWYALVAHGMPHRQARTLVMAARRADEIELARDEGPQALEELLSGMRGIGPWTTGYVLGTALAEPDAVLVGDYNLPHTTAWLLAGEERGTDERMLELLEPYRGNRFRAIRAIWLFGRKAPRRGPRRAPRPLFRV